MANRLRLIAPNEEWEAAVAGSEVTLAGARGPFAVRGSEEDGFEVVHDGVARRALGARAGGVVWVAIEGETFAFQVEAGTRRDQPATRHHDALGAPMPATVVRITVQPGDRVNQGDLLVALEAMKMELPIRAPRPGHVTAVNCREGDLVQPGAVLVELDD